MLTNKKDILIFFQALSFILCFGRHLSTTAQVEAFKQLPENIPLQEKENWLKTRSDLSSTAITDYDLIYDRCAWEIDPGIKYIQGSIVTYFKPLTTSFQQIEFDLSSELQVDSVKYHLTKLSFTLNTNDLLSIRFPGIIPQNTLDSLTIFYQGVPSTKNGAGAFVQSQHSGSPIIWTLSEPFGAKSWWPCKQNLSDKIDSIDILVKTLQGNRVASNGLLVYESTANGKSIFHWKSTYPIAAYLVAVGITNYVAYSDYVPLQTNTLQVLNYVYPEGLTETQKSTKDIVKIIQFFDSLLIDYPFNKEKYGHAQFGAGGGMEHQTMTFMGAFYLSLMAHECAHQWFGDYITCGSWEDIWLNEGFATFFEWQVTERYDKEGWVKGLPNIIKSITSEPGGSVLCDDTLSAARIFNPRLSYAKGAFLLRMLRFKLGDAVFFKTLKNYLNDPALKTKYAKTPQLIKHFESASGKNLSPFFDQWYYKEGFPTYTVSWTHEATSLSVSITQSQSHPSVPFFEMPVPIKFESHDRDTLLIFDHTFSGQTFTRSINFEAVKAHFDPNLQLLSANNKVIDLKLLQLSTIDLVLYPNPSDNSIRIEGLPVGTLLNRIEISDNSGKVLYEDKTTKVLSEALVISLQTFAGGSYQVYIETNLGSRTFKFIKE